MSNLEEFGQLKRAKNGKKQMQKASKYSQKKQVGIASWLKACLACLAEGASSDHGNVT
jgi:hypothetical protein